VGGFQRKVKKGREEGGGGVEHWGVVWKVKHTRTLVRTSKEGDRGKKGVEWEKGGKRGGKGGGLEGDRHRKRWWYGRERVA